MYGAMAWSRSSLQNAGPSGGGGGERGEKVTASRYLGVLITCLKY